MPGTIVHFELPARDAARSRTFWSGLFGWTFPDAAPDVAYHMAQVGPDQAGAIYESEEHAGSGVVVYFETDDVEAAIERVRSLGGSAEDRVAVPGHGWYAACRDTEGNAFRLWQADPSAASA